MEMESSTYSISAKMHLTASAIQQETGCKFKVNFELLFMTLHFTLLVFVQFKLFIYMIAPSKLSA